ncbi:MAG TPA: UDP-glucose 4-epimerase GalE [Acidobacteriota bacterium]
MHILVTGGAGYVGSHLVRALRDAGHRVAVLDDLSSGHRETVPDGVALQVGSCGDAAALDELTAGARPDAVMHLAAKCSVEESVADPALYYRANLSESLRLLDWVAAREIGMVVHSSTCAVYGAPERPVIDEQVCPRPVNPYGASKLAVDLALRAYGEAHGFGTVALRYFNAAGAHPDGTLGEDKTPAGNLIPCVLQAALGQRQAIAVYGDDYPTADGTGVRDYIHVMDLAAAHLAALEHLAGGGPSGVFNLGTGEGHSVLDVVAAGRRVTGREIPATVAPRRAGDPPALVADPRRARAELGWEPRSSDLDTILADAWRWRAAHPHGYRRAAEIER